MTSPNLENLVKTGQLKREPPATGENSKVWSDLPGHAWPMPASTPYPSKAASIWPTTPRMLWPWRHCAGTDTAPTIATSSFNACLIRWGSGPRCGACWRFATRGAIGEYEGFLEIDEQLVNDLVAAAVVLEGSVAELKPLV